MSVASDIFNGGVITAAATVFVAVYNARGMRSTERKTSQTEGELAVKNRELKHVMLVLLDAIDETITKLNPTEAAVLQAAAKTARAQLVE